MGERERALTSPKRWIKETATTMSAFRKFKKRNLAAQASKDFELQRMELLTQCLDTKGKSNTPVQTLFLLDYRLWGMDLRRSV